MNPKTFYKMHLNAEEGGLTVNTTAYSVIGETECYYYVVIKFDETMVTFAAKQGSETPVQCARRLKKLKKIDKRNSRFAFETEEKAYEHLKFLKRKQLVHMRREIAFIESFLKSEPKLDELKERRFYGNIWREIPGTEDLVKEYFNFD